jgi:hypothetical protein
MSVDLYKIQQKLEKPRKRKAKKKMAGFAVQKKALEATDYMAGVKRKSK